MKKKTKKIFLSLGVTTLLVSTSVSVLACSWYNPSKGDLQTRKFLSSKFAYNKAVADYYKISVNAMYNDFPTESNSIFNKKKFNLNNLRFDTFQWLISANSIQDSYYWWKQKNDWITKGSFIGSYADLGEGTKIKIDNLQDNKNFINGTNNKVTGKDFSKLGGLFTIDSYGNPLLKNDENTFKLLGGNPQNYNDIGSGVIMNTDRKLYTMSYLLLTKPLDVQNWLAGNPNDPGKHIVDTGIDKKDLNAGQYFLIDYLKKNMPFIMWKNDVTDTKIADVSFDGINKKNVDNFNDMSNTLQLKNAQSGSLTLTGGESKSKKGTPSTPTPAILSTLTSYVGFTTTNPFKKHPGGVSRQGDINPEFNFTKEHKYGYQGWVNDDGSIFTNSGNAVMTSSTTRTYAYVQQLLPKYASLTSSITPLYQVPDWMTSTTTNSQNKNTPVISVWNIAFQSVFYGSSLLSKAKNYWTNNGYYLKADMQTLIDNISSANLDKYND